MKASVYLMSPPAPDWTVRAKANAFSQAASPSTKPLGPQAIRDWLMIAEAIEQAGGRVLVAMPPVHQSLTGLPYTAEAGGFFVDKNGAPTLILPNMKPVHRHAEATFLAGFATALGWQTQKVDVLWEGQGDVIRVDENLFIHTHGEGASARTSKEAYAHVSQHLGGTHMQLGFKAEPWFHGNTFLGAFFHGTTGKPLVMVCPDALLPGEYARLQAFLGERKVFELKADESVAYATNALQVGRAVIAPQGLPAHVIRAWKDLSLDVTELPLEALFRHGGGAAVCLTNRLDGFDPLQIPQHLSLRHITPLLRAHI